MAIKGRKASSKNPPILSHEFVIQNHADIVSCIAMVFVIGLMIQVTSPFAYMFIAVHHNVTQEVDQLQEMGFNTLYTYGWKDICAVFFYFLICIVMHAIIQEYVLDKVSRKLHLSKAKHSKFNESGQLLTFYLLSVLWGGDIIFREGYLLSVGRLWESYPSHFMPFMSKFFFVVQMAYWLHCFPELYFQKVKREEAMTRARDAALALVFILAAYLLNFHRVGVCLVVLHEGAEALLHGARLLRFAEASAPASSSASASEGASPVSSRAAMAFAVANAAFVAVRLASVTLAVLTFWYGLALSPAPLGLDLANADFNVLPVRVVALSGVFALQAWLMWRFVTFHLRRRREQAPATPPGGRRAKTERRGARTAAQSHAKRRKDVKSKSNAEDDDLPEVDQNTKKALRSRASAKAKAS